MYTPFVLFPMLALAFAFPTNVERAASDNVQTFTGALGGAPPAVIESSGDRPFSVDGSTFVNKGAAIQRSCSVQHNGNVSFSVPQGTSAD